ncbi:MAG: TonB family protein [Sphingobacteriia bacterium]|nr:TonB family protein [Sphingobacteriia bacterium]
MAKTNIFSDAWCDIVFAQRFKDYGAFVIRRDSSRRHRVALIITIVFFVFAILAPGLIKSIIPEKKEVNVEVTALANIDLEKNKAKEQEQPVIEQAPPEKIKSTIKFTPPVIKDDSEVKDEDLMKTQEEVTDSKLSVSVNDVKGNSSDADAVDMADLQQEQSQVVEETQEPFKVVEQMPDYPGGDEARVKFLRDNIKYPSIARESGITGTVFLTFVIDKNGRISNIKVLRGIGGGCDEEAVRVVKLMPAWIPGKQAGKAVPVQFNLPIKFTLN